jgi:geranylgeranyl pyrophosphate synthase
MELAGINYSVSLDEVEDSIRDFLLGSDALVQEYVSLIAQGIGKRLRPLLLIMFADMFGVPVREKVVISAACCELLHTVSLIHDDVIDSADTRRGLVTLNNRFGNEAAVIVGDYILAQSFLKLTATRDFTILELTISASKKLGLGVLEEIRNRDKLSLAAGKYYEMIGLKTGALFALVCEGGAYLGGANEAGMAAAREFGRLLGLGFQVVDDLLDLTLSADEAGKPTFNDLREGRITLPIIHAYCADAVRTQALIDAYRVTFHEEEAKEVRAWLVEAGALKQALCEAEELITQARVELGRISSVAAHPEKAAGIYRVTDQVLARIPEWVRCES